MNLRSCKEAMRLSNFKDFHSHWDHLLQSHIVKILPGQFYVTQGAETLVTTLGSCVSACIRDISLGIGGMNHFMLPEELSFDRKESDDSPWNTAARYGNNAMELLINAILKNGGERKNLEIKVFGGAKILNMRDIGNCNIAFIRKYLQTEELPIAAEDMGGCCPRKVIYVPSTGKARVKQLSPLMNTAIVRREQDYSSNLKHNELSGTVELFDEFEMD
jgi:chemotaxis protein CheD